MAFISDSQTILGLLEQNAEHSAGRSFASFEGQEIRTRELRDKARQTAYLLAKQGVRPGDRVAVMLDNHLDNLVLFFALVWVGAIHVPVNTRLRYDSLRYLVEHSRPKLIIVEDRYVTHLPPQEGVVQQRLCVTHKASEGFEWSMDQDALKGQGSDYPGPADVQPSDVISIMYTSGTTGPPKGVKVTDKMLRASAFASAKASGAVTGDIFLVWEPLYHIGALQLLPLALGVGVQLALVDRFSVSRFWDQVRETGATQIHFLGGILQMLLRQKATVMDTRHPCRIAWGGGAPAGITTKFQARFNLEVRENYGMTEASSLTSINKDGHKGSVGKPAPYFEVRVVDGEGHQVATGYKGEIIVRELEQGLITPGYFEDEKASREVIRDGWLFTGDIGYFDESGYLYYAGRLKDSIRRRGENISAWEIERVVEQLEYVEQAAAIGVPDEIGDEEIKLFVKLAAHAGVSSPGQSVFRWCEERLPGFQVPKYLSIVDEFPMTGTERIRKELLSPAISGSETMVNDITGP